MRCAAHSLQLVVTDVLKIDANKKILTTIRDITKNSRNIKFRTIFEDKDIPLPTMDVITRWGSTYKMVNCFFINKDFFQELANEHSEFYMTEETWRIIENFEKAFKPLYITTKKLKEEQLLMGIKYINFPYKIFLKTNFQETCIFNGFFVNTA
jgi:hypothetical protein